VPGSLALAGVALAAAGAGAMLAMAFAPVPRMVQAGAALTAAALALAVGPEAPTAAFLIWTALLLVPLVAIALTDAATREIPDLLTLALAAGGLARLALSGGPVWPLALAALALALCGLAIDRFAPSAPVGAGDFLLVAGGLIWTGPLVLIELALICGVLLWLHWLVLWALAMAGLLPRDRLAGVPFAPSYAIALALMWFSAP
jgi:hypothetical protein